jgi:hypothetical protein
MSDSENEDEETFGDDVESFEKKKGKLSLKKGKYKLGDGSKSMSLNRSSSCSSRNFGSDRLDYVETKWGEEVFWSCLLFPALISSESLKESEKYFIGRIEGCPDRDMGPGWSDTKPKGFGGVGPTGSMILDTQRTEGVATVYNLYFRSSHLFQEFILDLAVGFPETNIFAFTNKGAYLRDKEGKWEAWSSFMDLSTEITEGKFGGSYDLDAAYPKGLEGVFKDESWMKRAEEQGLLDLKWSRGRMEPFEVVARVDESRILTKVFFARNGVGFKKADAEKLPAESEKEYKEAMSVYEARRIMYELSPMYPIGINLLAGRIREGLQGEELISAYL